MQNELSTNEIYSYLKEILEFVGPERDPDFFNDIEIYNDVGEWSLAYENLCLWINHDKIPISRPIYEKLKACGKTVDLFSYPVIQKKLWLTVEKYMQD